MSQPFRLNKEGLINRNKKISFTFNGKKLFGYEGDTIASALIANGIHLVGRSFKYHRPRGFFGAGVEEPNAKLQVEFNGHSEPNVNATEMELVEGLSATSQNCWPSVNFDIGAINNFLKMFFPAGFYYKTFMWPKSFWYKIYEPFIRKAAGLGVASIEKDKERYEHKFEYCDLLVTGSGPSGLASAYAAAKNGAKVILAEDKPRFGGTLLTDDVSIDNLSGKDWAEKIISELKSMPNVTVKNRSQVFGYYDHNMLVMFERVSDHLEKKSKFTPRQRLWYIRAKETILSTGSIERPIVFGNNDTPGIFLSAAAKEYMKVYGVLVGKKPLIFTNNDSAYETALEFKKNNVEPIILDTREEHSSELIDEAKSKGIDIRFSHGVIVANGYKKVKSAKIGKLNKDKNSFEKIETVDCDCICVSGFWTPSVHLASQSGNKLKYEEKIDAFIPDKKKQHETSVGAANGSFTLEESLKHGFENGSNLSAKITETKTEISIPNVNEKKYGAHDKFWCMPLPKNENPKRFVDFQNDVSVSDIEIALREGYRSIEHVKRYTTLGMATDQGRTSNLNGLQLVSNIENKIVPEVGHTTFRPPFTPITIGTIVGREVGMEYMPTRKTPMHEWHEKNNAVFVDAGAWKRPRYYKQGNETLFEASKREAKNVRDNVGICDVTTLGKIDIKGPDAAEFLNRVYTNAWSKLEIGSCRYGLMCNEHGMIFDDGVTSRLGENHYHMTTTTGGAARVMSWLEEFLQTEWLDMKVFCTSVTEQWAVLSISGPNSREFLKDLTNIDLSKENFPFMKFREGEVCGVKARIFRISFTGELSYEVNVPARYGRYVWEKFMEHGKKYNITPYGTETMHVLRAEKGFIIVGQDTDGSVTPSDMNMDWIVSKKKEDFLGKRSFTRPDTVRHDRKKFVGLLVNDKKTILPEGSHIVEKALKQPPMKMLGHVTSSYYSPTLGYPIALAMLKDGFSKMGEQVVVPLMNGKIIEATVTDTIFYDKEGKRNNE